MSSTTTISTSTLSSSNSNIVAKIEELNLLLSTLPSDSADYAFLTALKDALITINQLLQDTKTSRVHRSQGKNIRYKCFKSITCKIKFLGCKNIQSTMDIILAMESIIINLKIETERITSTSNNPPAHQFSVLSSF